MPEWFEFAIPLFLISFGGWGLMWLLLEKGFDNWAGFVTHVKSLLRSVKSLFVRVFRRHPIQQKPIPPVKAWDVEIDMQWRHI